MSVSARTHEALIAGAPAELQGRLRAIQAEVERVVPQAERCVGYRMPAFRCGRIFFYFSAFNRHIGIYPPLTNHAALVTETAPFRGPKGNLSFAHAQPLPLELIGRVAQALAAQYGTR
jgi:uncharacterized protein YdhG (YjbR/CyaY superfamily)